ncbi:glycosyltransferase [Bdellovibrio sp. HCB274]|uniref:glycosyltransferase n=1 Tax=Bdellovibrio sp. HCB274 TaxID=3394361 RepID=UPI0039B4C34D
MALILDIGRPDSGMEKYSSFVIANLNPAKHILLESKYKKYSHHFTRGTHSVRSYTSPKDIIWKTIFVLPYWLLAAVFFCIIKNQRTIYLPYFNHWNVFFAVVYRLLGGKVVLTVHDGKMHLGDYNPITQFLMNLNILLATDIIVLSNHVISEIPKSLLNGKKIHLVPHGIIEVNDVIPLEIVTSKPTILFIGKISKYKGIELLLEAMKDIPDDSYEKLVIAGKANYEITFPPNPKFRILNKWLSATEIAELINASDIMIFPYLEATQSGALTLAISGCRPIICTDVGGLTEQVSPEEAVIVKPLSESISKAVSGLIQDTERRASMIKSLKNKKQELSWAELGKKIDQVIG